MLKQWIIFHNRYGMKYDMYFVFIRLQKKLWTY